MGTPEWAPTARPDLQAFVPRERRLGPLVLWLGCLGVGLALLLWLGDGRLAAPDLTAPSTWGDWARARGTAEATVAVLRIVALGLAWYLVGITAVSVLAHAARAARLVRVADALSFGPVRAVVQQALGVGLAAGVVASALPAGAWGGQPAPVAAASVATVEADVTDQVGTDPTSDPGASGSPGGVGGPATDARVTPTPGPGDTGRATSAPLAQRDGPVEVIRPAPVGSSPAADAAAADAATPAAEAPTAAGDAPTAAAEAPTTASEQPPEPDVATVADASEQPAGGTSDAARDEAGLRETRVEPGDHLWGLAEDDLRAALGRQPTEAEIVSHWERVIEANRDRLEVPSNPDLLRPGQVVVLPDVEVGS